MVAVDAAHEFVAKLVDYARRRPDIVIVWILGFHVVVWTLLPILLSPNLQLDLVEGVALGREWQVGYWKHPPLPWWITDIVYRITGQLDAVYVLGPLAAVICLYAVWHLAREMVGGFRALIAVVALEAIHFYNFSAVKFAHDQMQLPFWALTGLFFWRAITRGRVLDWTLAGIFLAGAFWSKYAVFALAVTLGLVLLFDPLARRAWRTPGPYVMAVAFAIVVAPNVWWLVTNDFMPLHYVDDRAATATRWYYFLLFPLQWIGGQALYIAPALALLGLLYVPRRSGKASIVPADGDALNKQDAFNTRYVTALAVGPFAVTTIIAAVTARQPVALWGYPLWSFLPLALMLLAPPELDPVRLRRFAMAAAGTLMAFPIGFAAVEIGEPWLRDRLKATQFPGRLLAETLTQRWREKTGNPLTYVGGAMVYRSRYGARIEAPGAGQFASNNIAVYSPDQPHVIVNGELSRSPWIDPADLDRRGAVLAWQAEDGEMPENLRRTYPRAELQPPIVLPRQTVFAVAGLQPVIVYNAIVLPRP